MTSGASARLSIRASVPILPAGEAKGLVREARQRGAWPLKQERLGQIVFRTRRVSLVQQDDGDHVADPRSRERLALTFDLLGDRLDRLRVEVDGAPRAPEETVTTRALVTRVRAEGLPPGARFEVLGAAHDPPPEPPDVAGPDAVDAAWERIERRLATLHPDGAAVLRGSADEAEIAALEARVGGRLPDALRRSLLRHDGQEEEVGHDEAPPFIADGKWLLTTARILQRWEMWRKVVADDEDDDYRPAYLVTFADDDTGDGVGVELRDGRILGYMDTVEPWLVAPRYESWLTLWADQLDEAPPA